MSNQLKKVFFYGVAFNAIRMLVGAISAVYLVSQGLNVFDVGLIKTLQAVVILFLDIPLAFLSDLYSRKLSIVLATVCAVVWLVLTGVAGDLWVFYVAEIFNALSLALMSGAFVSYLICVGKGTGVQHHQLIGKYQAYQFFSMAAASFIGAMFVDVQSSQIWFIAGALCMFLAVGFSWFMPPDIYARKSQEQSLQDASKKILNLYGQQLAPVLLFFLATSVYYQILIQLWQIVLRDSLQDLNFITHTIVPALKPSEASSLQSSGYVYGFVFVVILMVQALAGHLVSKAQKIYSICWWALFFALVAFFLLMCGMWWASWAYIVSVVVMFFSQRLIMVGLQGLFHSYLDDKWRATLDSILSSLIRLILLIVLPLASYLVQLKGWGALALVYGLVIFIGCVCLKQLVARTAAAG